ncbi:MAG: hypothetical protein J5J06_15265 [Phycisphaerae bacterium]|nr:hypothetical protein [Phycisphaerae bacterium]
MRGASVGAGIVLLVGVALAGCVDVNVPDSFSLLPVGTSFIMRGTSAVVDDPTGQPCLVWIGENGVTYYLFQDARLENETFDRITTPGTTSRLQLATRSDLEASCQIGTIVEVEDVLEIAD